jgi:3-oxoacyl-[acyl-carrier-protein] synthase-3
VTKALRDVYFAGTGRALPDRRLTNADLFEMPSIRAAFDVEHARGSLRDVSAEEASSLEPVDVFDRWAVQLTGIRERRVLAEGPDETTEALCARAAEAALEHAGMAVSDLDFVVAGSVSPREIVPNIALTVADRIGVPRLPGFSFNTACAGFVHGVAIAWAWVSAGLADAVLVVTGDALTHITNYDDPKTAVLFGDGAGSIIVTAAPGPGRIPGPASLSADYSPDHLNLVGVGWGVPGGPEHCLSMAGGAHVLRNAIRTMEEAIDEALERAGGDRSGVDFVVPHQANERITQGLERSLRLPKGRVIHRIATLGNVSAATVPITLDELLRGELGPLPPQARIVVTAVGGGYTSGAAVLDWAP